MVEERDENWQHQNYSKACSTHTHTHTCLGICCCVAGVSRRIVGKSARVGICSPLRTKEGTGTIPKVSEHVSDQGWHCSITVAVDVTAGCGLLINGHVEALQPLRLNDRNEPIQTTSSAQDRQETALSRPEIALSRTSKSERQPAVLRIVVARWVVVGSATESGVSQGRNVRSVQDHP